MTSEADKERALILAYLKRHLMQAEIDKRRDEQGCAATYFEAEVEHVIEMIEVGAHRMTHDDA